MARLIDDDVFDYLFVLETWYVEHAVRCVDPRVIAATDIPSSPPTSGHHPGRIMLLGTPRARGWLRGPAVSCRQEAITIPTSHSRLTGVYLPPRLSPEQVKVALDAIVDSDIILSDINTRFDGLTLQHRSPGPSSQLEVFRRWMDSNPLTHVMPTGDKQFVASSPCETMLNVDHCFVRDDLRSHVLQLPSTGGLGIMSNHRYVLSLSLGGVTCEEKKTLQLPRYRIGLLGEQLRADAVCREWGRRTEHRRDLLQLTSDVERQSAQIVAMCQQVSEAALGKRPDKRRRYQTRKGPNGSQSVSAEDDASIVSSIRLYKRAARSSQENGPLLPTPNARLKGLSAIEEVAAGLSERFSSESPGFATLDNAFEPDSTTQDYVSIEDIAAELRHQDSNKACGMDGVHICLMQTLASTSFVHVLAALYNSCIKYAKTPCA